MKIKRVNVYKVRWLRLENELKKFKEKFPNKSLTAQIIIDSMEVSLVM